VADFANIIKRDLKVSLDTIKHDLQQKKDPLEFIFNGSQMFHGMQGEGKTVSMYKYGMDVFYRFKRSVIVTNLVLTDLKPVHIKDVQKKGELQDFHDKTFWRTHYIQVVDFEDVMLALRTIRNGSYGVIFMIDEIHTYFHSHDSKSIPMWVAQVFSQQRKQKLTILGTVQDWEDLTKIIRRQARNLVLCHKVGYFITQTVVDPRTMEMEYGEQFFAIKKKGFFFLSRKIRDGMDTYQVIDSGRSVMGGNEMNQPVSKNKNGTLVRKTKYGYGRSNIQQTEKVRSGR